MYLPSFSCVIYSSLYPFNDVSEYIYIYIYIYIYYIIYNIYIYNIYIYIYMETTALKTKAHYNYWCDLYVLLTNKARKSLSVLYIC